MKFMLLYLLIFNALGFALMLTDKRNARRNLWRIPERTLIAVSILGGSLGVFTAMKLLRHKIRHSKFSIGVPLTMIIHILMTVLISELLQK